MNKFKQKLVAGLLVVVVLVGGVWAFTQNRSEAPLPNNQTEEQTQILGVLAINEDQKTVGYDGQEGKTALEILKSLADVKTDQSSFGEFVSGINGIAADSNSEYWSFYVNGSYASEGAGTYVTKSGDRIEWKLEKL